MEKIDKKDWKRVKLGDVCDRASSNIAQNKITKNEGLYPIFGASGLIKYVDFFHRDEEYIGLIKDGSGVGRANIFPAQSSVIGTLQYILPKENIYIKYLLYTLQGLKLEQYVTGIAIPHIYFKDYSKELIYLPPLPTQHQIVKELDCLSTLLEKQKQQLAELDTLAQAIFYDMFGDPVTNEKGWEKKKLGEVCSFASGLVNPLELPYSDMLHVGGDNIESGTGILKNLKFAKELGLKSGKFLFSPEDILYNKIRPNLNKVALPDFVGICSADMYPIQPKARVTNKYFLYFILKSEGFLAYAETQSRRANIPKMNVQQMSAYIHILPPLPLQQQFASKIEAIELQKEKVQASIKDTQQLFDYTMDKYFN